MHFTPIRAAALALTACIPLAACGQVTGLSDDYTYDLEGGAAGATDGGAAEGAVTDAKSGDSSDAATKCSPSQTTAASSRLAPSKGTAICKSCLASSCCTDVTTCAANGDCEQVLTCKLECTEKTGQDRTQCFRSCTVSGGPNGMYTTTVGTCAQAACTMECGLQ
jgi:hypothetical protein